MTHIRVRLSIKLNGDHSPDLLPIIKSCIEQSIAPNLPDGIAVDTIKVTRINEAKPQPASDDASE